MIFRLYFAMLQFMSRLPIPARWSQGLEMNQYVRGIVTFPFIGLLLGALAGGVFIFLLPWSGLPLAALSYVLTLALLTGGFHLDGLADTFDGIFSARTRERMLEIMRDSRLGTHGGLALIFVLLAKVLVVSELSLRGYHMLGVLAAASVAGRSACVMLMYRQNYAREKGMGNLFIGKVSGKQALFTLIAGAVLCLMLVPAAGLWALAVTFITIMVFALALRRTLGGHTGDTLGAAIELGEVIFLLALL